MTDERLARLLAIYEALPKVECQKKCWSSCGPISMTRLEADRIEQASGRTVKHSVRIATDTVSAQELMDSIMCPFLTPDKLCSVYEVRPYICRSWGSVTALPCEYGCKVTGALPWQEESALLDRLIAEVGDIEVSTASRHVLDIMRRTNALLTKWPRCNHCNRLAMGDVGGDYVCHEHAFSLYSGQMDLTNISFKKIR